MKHPALTRALAVFLAIVSALTLFSGAWSIRKAEKDRETSARRTELLTGQIERASELADSVGKAGDEARRLAAELPERQDAYRSAANTYRADLNQYTLTRAGVIIGRQALAQATAALQQGKEQLEAGRRAFEQGQAVFEPVYALYLNARAGLDSGWGLWQEGINRLSLEEEAPEDHLQAEDALLLVGTARAGLGAAEALMESIRSETPADQAMTAETLRDAIRALQTISAVGSGDVMSLSVSYAEGVYRQARAIVAEQTAAGKTEEEAWAQADAYVRQTLGLSYAELENWLEENRTETVSQAAQPAAELSDEQLDMLLAYLPSDPGTLDEALAILAEEDKELALREEEIRADPEAVNGSELLLSLFRQRLESTDRLLALVEPQILETKRQLDLIAGQLDAAEGLLAEGDRRIQQGWYSLYVTEQGLTDTEAELRERKAALETEYQTLAELEEKAESYEELSKRSASACAGLLSHEEIARRVEAGEELFAAAEQVRDELHERTETERRDRLRICVLMLTGALFGLLAAFSAFEILPVRRGWTLLAPAGLLTSAGELQSVLLGRGLWYTAIFVAITAFVMLPFSFRRQ